MGFENSNIWSWVLTFLPPLRTLVSARHWSCKISGYNEPHNISSRKFASSLQVTWLASNLTRAHMTLQYFFHSSPSFIHHQRYPFHLKAHAGALRSLEPHHHTFSFPLRFSLRRFSTTSGPQGPYGKMRVLTAVFAVAAAHILLCFGHGFPSTKGKFVFRDANHQHENSTSIP